MITEIIKLISSARLPLQDEKELQDAIDNLFKKHNYTYDKEYILDAKNRIDFFAYNEIGIEVKIKGGIKSIYKQCERYCSFDKIKTLILVTNRTMGFPESINGKPCFVVKLGKAWL